MADTKTDSELEAQRSLLKSLIDSEGWKFYVARWASLHEQVDREMKSPECQNRDWLAGLVVGYERMMQWPIRRIHAIDTELQKRHENRNKN